MNVPREAPAEQQGKVDTTTRHTLARVAFRVGGATIFILWPYLAGTRPLATVLALLSTFVAVASIFCGLVALLLMLLKEPIGRGGPNHWDEALIYVALTRLVHLAYG